MSAVTITFRLDADNLTGYTDAHLAQLWHISQANPAPFGDRDACDFAEQVGREIIRRFVTSAPPELWAHQGRHVDTQERAQRNVQDSMDKHLQDEIQPGASVTAQEVLQALDLPLSVTNESILRSAFSRAGFNSKRSTTGCWTWTAPPANHQEDLVEPHQELGRRASQPHASHRQEALADHLPQEGLPPTEQLGKTASHQFGLGSLSAVPSAPSGSGETSSLVGTEAE